MNALGQVAFELDLMHQLRLSPQRIRQNGAVGAIVNHNDVHWVAVTKDTATAELWLLDSQADGPMPMTFEDFTAYVSAWPHSYLVEDLRLP